MVEEADLRANSFASVERKTCTAGKSQLLSCLGYEQAVARDTKSRRALYEKSDPQEGEAR
jgi:hypothetical protein